MPCLDKKNNFPNSEIPIEQSNDYSKLKVDEIKNELKKKGISFSKNLKKNELIELLSKSDEGNK